MIVGCIGLGRMGGGMARQIAEAGFSLVVNDIDADALLALSDLQPDVAANPVGVATQSDVILTSLPGPTEVAEVYTGTNGIIAGLRPGTILLETSTIGPALSRDLANLCGERGAHFLDAPLSGGVDGAREGTLTVMVGGDPNILARATPVLDAIASSVRYMGPTGSGNVTKLINQMVYLTYSAALCEGFAFGERYGLEPNTLLDVLETSMAGQPMMSGWQKRLPRRDIKGGFLVYRVLKDLRLGRDAKLESGAATPVFDAALKLFEDAEAAGHTHVDLTVVRDLLLGRVPPTKSA